MGKKIFYNAAEAAARLGVPEAELKEMVRKGSLREFRDAGSVNYKVDDIDGLAGKLSAAPKAPAPSPKADSRAGASASGEIILEPVEDSTINLASSGSDIMELESVDADDTATGMKTAATRKKEDSAVPSVGVNVFDDDELDELVDPLAQTAVTDVGGLGIEGMGSGSGILDLTRESDDTSLGAELLEEIYTGEDSGTAKVEMGDDTRAGLDDAIPEEKGQTAGPEEDTLVGATEAVGAPRAMVTRVVEFAPDATSTALTAAMMVGVVVIWFAGLAALGMLRGMAPSLVQTVYGNLLMYAGIAVGAAVAAGAGTYFWAKRSS